MIFRRLRVQAFNRFKAPFEISLDLGGIVFVEGVNLDGQGTASSNGAGKSLAVIEAPLWCLFGKMARYGDRVIGDQVSHPLNGADVTIEMEHAGVPLIFRRTRAPKGRGAFEVTVPVSKDVQKRADDVAEILGLDYRSFRAAVIVSGDDALASSAFADQMAVLEAVLRVDELSDASERAAKAASVLDGQRAVASAEHLGKQRALTEATSTLTALQDSAANEELLRQVEVLRRSLEQSESASALVEPLRESLERQRASLAVVAKASEEIRAEQAVIARKQAEVSARISVRTSCPTCQRSYENAEEIEHAAQVARTELARLGEALSALGIRGSGAERGLRTEDGKVREIEGELRTAEMHARSADPYRISLRQIEEAIAAHEVFVQSAQENVARLQKEVETSESVVFDLQHALSIKRFWALHFGRDRLQARVFQVATPVLNEAASRYALALTGGEIGVTFNPVRESKTEELIRIDGGSAPTFDGLSAGEKERVNLVVALSVRALARWRLPEPINVSVYDETFDRIDEAGLSAVSTLLQEEAQHGTVFVVSHRPELKRLFPGSRTVQVIRQNREATVTCS